MPHTAADFYFSGICFHHFPSSLTMTPSSVALSLMESAISRTLLLNEKWYFLQKSAWFTLMSMKMTYPCETLCISLLGLSLQHQPYHKAQTLFLFVFLKNITKKYILMESKEPNTL